MKSLQRSLKKWRDKNVRFEKQFSKLRREILSDVEIQTFLQAYPHLSKETIDKHLHILYEYKMQSIRCAKCSSLKQCSNILKGYTPRLTAKGQTIHISYVKCKRLLQAEEKQQQQKLIEGIYIPKEILEATFERIEPDPKRVDAIREMTRFIDQLKEQEMPQKGIYFSGPFGVGKTFLLGALANKLKEYRLSTTIIYMPEFVRSIRESIKDDSINEKINYFKRADVLMLDDIGAETQSAWFRDEVLGSILQYRMMERLPVFFTSNYTMDQLEEQLSKTTRGDIERVKAGRIMERIRQVSREVKVSGRNRRYED